MIGSNIAVATSIINSVVALDELSHTVRLCDGCDEDGKIKGNILTPTVAIIPKIDRALDTKAILPNCEQKIDTKGHNSPRVGAVITMGYAP